MSYASWWRQSSFVTRHRVALSASSFSRRRRWSFLDRWSQNLTMMAPSRANMRSKSRISVRVASNALGSVPSSTRLRMGVVYQEPR